MALGRLTIESANDEDEAQAQFCYAWGWRDGLAIGVLCGFVGTVALMLVVVFSQR